MFFKIMILIFILVIFYSLGSALFFLVRDKEDSNRVAKALTWRIGLSFFLFLLIMFAFYMGWIQPHGL